MVSSGEPSKRRRSLFSALFASNAINNNTSHQQHLEQQDSSRQHQSLKKKRRSTSKTDLSRSSSLLTNSNQDLYESRRSSVGSRLGLQSSLSNQPNARNRAALLVAQNDIVIVPAEKAKCVEKLIKVASDKGQTSSQTQRSDKTAKSEEKATSNIKSHPGASNMADIATTAAINSGKSDVSVMKRLLNRMTGKSSSSAGGGGVSSGEGSYVEELNYRIELEKRRHSSMQRQAKVTSASNRNSVPPNFFDNRIQILKSSTSNSLNDTKKQTNDLVGGSFNSTSRKSLSRSSSLSNASIFTRSGDSPRSLAWHSNENYIPKMTGINELPEDGVHSQKSSQQNKQQVASPKGPAQASNQAQQQHPSLIKRHQTSPLLEQFLASHRIRFDSLTSLATTHSTATSSSGSSSCNSLSCQQRRQRQNENSKMMTSAAEAAPATGDLMRQNYRVSSNELIDSKMAALDASSQRLMHWQSLSTRNANDSTSVEKYENAKLPLLPLAQIAHRNNLMLDSDHYDSSDDLEFLDESSPTFVCYCSDDTSCSSVELVWSTPQLTEQRRKYRQQQEQLRNQNLNHQNQNNLHTQQQQPVAYFASYEMRRPVSVSPKHLLSNQNSRQYENTNNHWQSLVLNQDKTAQRFIDGNQHHQLKPLVGIRQHAAVLELAKPSRAKDRHIRSPYGVTNQSDDEDADYVRLRSREQRRERRRRQKLEDEQMKKTSPAPIAHPEANTSSPDTKSVKPSEQASSSDWVPNPLFDGATSAPNSNTGSQNHPTGRQSIARQVSCADLSKNIEPPIDSDIKSITNGSRQLDIADKLDRCKELLRLLKGGSSNKENTNPELSVDNQDQCKSTKIDLKSSNGSYHSSNEDYDDVFDNNNLDSSSSNFKSRHHRWSLRVGSTFKSAASSSKLRSLDAGSAYLNNIMNLDRKIKSNVSSLKSQLGEKISDTSKRASVLADQLITSIKDTTKEQIVPFATGIQPRDDPEQDSFAGPLVTDCDNPPATSGKQNWLDTSEKQADTNNNSKARMFSLIYKHQQNINGQPVITKQPRATHQSKVPVPIKRLTQSLVAKNETGDKKTSDHLSSDRNKTPTELFLLDSANKAHLASPHCRTIAVGQLGRLELDARQSNCGRNGGKIKRLRPRKMRRQINKAIVSENEDSDCEVRSFGNHLRKNVTY